MRFAPILAGDDDAAPKDFELPPPPVALSAIPAPPPAPGTSNSGVFPMAYSYLNEGWEPAGGRRTLSGKLRWEDDRDSWF